MGLLQLRRSAAGILGVRKMAPGVWLRHQRGTDLEIVQLGSTEHPVVVISDRDASEQNKRQNQRALFNHLGNHLLAQVLIAQQVNVVLDVGANRGQFAALLRRLGYAGRIVSYEPVPANLRRLRKAAANDPDWIVEGFALGDTDEQAEINVSGGAGKLSSLLSGNEFGRERFAHMREEALKTQTISIKRLDAVYDQAVAGIDTPRVFMKMDTQGYDLKAFAGAGDLVNDFVGLQSELSCIPIYEGMPHLTEQYTTYEQAGFAAVSMTPVSRDYTTLAAIEFDLLMVRR